MGTWTYAEIDGDFACDFCGVWVQDTELHSGYHDGEIEEEPRTGKVVTTGPSGPMTVGGGGGGGSTTVLGSAAAQLRWADHGKTLERERIQRLAVDVRAHYHDPITGESRSFAEFLGAGQ